MSYGPLVTVKIPPALESAVQYAKILDQFNHHAPNVLLYLLHTSERASDAGMEFSLVLINYRLSFRTGDRRTVVKAKESVLTTATYYGMGNSAMREFRAWLDRYGRYAELLADAEAQFFEQTSNLNISSSHHPPGTFE